MTMEAQAKQKAADELFTAAMQKHLQVGQKSWDGTHSRAVIADLLVGKDGNPVELSTDNQLLLTVLANPTLDTQMQVLKKLAADSGCELDEYHLMNIRRLINPQLFEQELEKAEAIEKPKKPRKTPMKALLRKA
jgi:hypothetical protein